MREQLVESLARDRCLETEWDEDCDGAEGRIFSADSEDLAEGAVGAHLRRMKPTLEREGVLLSHVEDITTADGRGYAVNVGGRTYTVCSAADEAAGLNAWALAAKAFAEIVNDLLISAGSAERAYLIGGGNDGRVILLTGPMYAAVKETDVIAEVEKPYPPEEVELEG